MDLRKELTTALTQAVAAAQAAGDLPAGEYPEPELEQPPQKEFGDFATNIAMQSARVARRAPRQIAEVLLRHLASPLIERTEIAGAGFINIFLKNAAVYDVLRDILARGDAYGDHPLREEDTVQVEYVSANPTGPLHIGHGRGAAFGSALVNLFRAAGYNTQAEYYINDAGNQIDNLALSVNARYLELCGKPADFPENGYHGQDIIETAQAILAADGEKYLALPEEERLAIFKERALKEKLARLHQDLEAFRVEFDDWFSERTLHPEAIREAVEELQARGKIYEQDGALWLKTVPYGDDKDRVVIRANGVGTYLASDIAYHRNKFERGFRRMINIWGADHHGYVCRVKASMAALGYDPDRLEILLLQMVNLLRGGEAVKMSKRTGQAITLSELIEEVGTDAARYFFIMRSLDSQLDFDIDLAKSHSNENPVYYIQYAHARIHSIYRQAEEAGIRVGDWDETDFTILQEEAELALIKTMSEYRELILQAAEFRAPHRIARYLYDLAGQFHSFYKQCRILGIDPSLQQARLGLITATRHILAHGLGILGISAPERM
ncbi:MAG: arginine--tRNA ligase [Veillonellaceae bacterium]|nr:arginine--tRNA ligase [Veillonellaceae bacterium]